MEGRYQIFVMAIDLQKAFDTVNQKAVPEILKDKGVPYCLINRVIKACLHENTLNRKADT